MARPRNPNTMPADELQRIVAALGGIRATARAAGLSHVSLSAYLGGARGVPAWVATRLRLAEFDARLKGFTERRAFRKPL